MQDLCDKAHWKVSTKRGKWQRRSLPGTANRTLGGGGYKRWNVNKGKLETVTLEFDDSFVAVGYWSTFMEACEVDGQL